MHAEIVPKYHRYLADKETIKAELNEWLKTYSDSGPKHGYIPVTESRSSDDDLEDKLQRFYLTKEQIEEARELNPMAEFNTARDSDSDSVDWSKSGCVNPPGLQGQCGSCWAFASLGALEAAQCIANGDKKAPSYSEQHLVSCDTKDFGCNGGAPVYAMQYLRDNGVCTESSYPYTSVEGGTAAACVKTCTPVKSGITDIAQLKSGDESALLGALKKQPVVVSVISNNPMWKQYKSGVITSCNTATVDHAVLAVGYDATTIKIKNSWGTEWGEDGYVRISRSSQGMGTCAVLTDMSYPKV
ncbi:Thiol protease [Phytophthora nicotianae]|uniref:Thiol protease n=1 Tax=Phytophthora nicotianae TaxID=4792 RepID=A0A0W8D114_PHYNI|nr:Thiol protease [Phytophthora nicotianae]